MRKTIKKNRIIILIAISLIISIVGILIWTNVIKVNILNGKFNSANNDSNNVNLLAENIKDGITLGGVTGTLKDLDTSDATATAEDIWYERTAYVDGKKITGTKGGPMISKTESYVGNYADIEGDGLVDGIIFADLAVGGSGSLGAENTYYEIPIETNLKEYYIRESYNGAFGEANVIVPMEETTGNDRFYVMALEDVNSGVDYDWYHSAFSYEDNTIIDEKNDFGQGRANTEYIKSKWDSESWGKQNSGKNLDLWGAIENEIAEGWFLPSKSEFAAFANTCISYILYDLRILL